MTTIPRSYNTQQHSPKSGEMFKAARGAASRSVNTWMTAD